MASDQNSIDDIVKQAKLSKDNPSTGEPGTKISEPGLKPGKIIDRLDDVTLQSEVEACKVVDIIYEIMSRLEDTDDKISRFNDLIKSRPNSKKTIAKSLEDIILTNKESENMLFNAMDLLQYQDILRQKVEKIAASLCVFYDYLGEFLGNSKKKKKAKTSKIASVDIKKSNKGSQIIDILDDVTVQSEMEASKVIDMIDDILKQLGNTDKTLSELKDTINEEEKDKLKIVNKIGKVRLGNKEAQDMLYNTMNLLQYQDIIRQKIEKAADSLCEFHDYLGEFLGMGRKKKNSRTTGRHIEDSTLERDQKLDEIDEIIRNIKGD